MSGPPPEPKVKINADVELIFKTGIYESLATIFDVSKKTAGIYLRDGVPERQMRKWKRFKEDHAKAVRGSK